MRSIQKTELAYLAGIVDSEGTFAIYRHVNKQCKSGYGYCVYLSITNSDPILKEWLIKVLQQGHISKQRRVYSPGDCYRYNLHANGLRELLPHLLNYLIVKRNEAELVLEFLDLTYRVNRLDFMTQTNQRRESIVDELRALHKCDRIKKVSAVVPRCAIV